MRQPRSGRATSPEQRDVHSELLRLHEAAAAGDSPAWEARGTTVRAIEEQLGALWAHPDDRGALRDGHLPRARASVLNLIVTVTDAEAAERAVHTMMDLGVRHPSRAIV
ncbi:MAG TPA: hypothetical protein VFM74_06335, partial [Candidatus Limnocylindria bacterium]|nr:hypothetical protein [Candidatus Limnocylindria bacterium]